MHIKLVPLLFFLLSFPSLSFTQTDIESIVREGIEYHDNGEFEKAIETYKKALEIDPESALVNYEIAYSYLSKGDYEKVIEYSDVVLKHNKDFLLETYITKGSALDLLGKTEESIQLFEKGIKETGGHYLLHYNLALNYFNINDLENAEVNTIKAIEFNLNHPTSHLILANIHNQKGNIAKTLLSTHYFLFLEPNTGRSKEAFSMYKNAFGANAEKDKSKSNTINVSFASDESPFSTAELMVAMMAASNLSEENDDKTEEELFLENTQSFFKVLQETYDEEKQDIWSFYTEFFSDLADTEHIETYCYYILQSDSEDAAKWLDENTPKLQAFDKWLKEH